MPSDVRLLAGVASAVLALVCLASAGRLALALRRGGSRQGAALVWTMAALAVGGAAAASAIALDYDTSLIVLASGALLAAAAALAIVVIGNVDQLVDGGRGKRQLALLAEQRGNALATATRLSEVAERASTREAVLDLLIEGVRAAVGSDEVAVIEADAGDRDAVSVALSDAGMIVSGAVVVPLLSAPALSLATSRASGRSEEVVAQLESLAAAARPALAAVEARARVEAARAARSAAAQVLRRLLSLRDVADVADAFTGELRERLPLRAVGLRLIDEPEHWTPERPAEHAQLEERALVLGDTGLGTLWLWLERPLRADELALLDLCCDHAPPAFGLARMRASLREARLAQAALVRAAETVGGELDLDVLLGKLAAASARMLGADAAAVWVHDPTSEQNRVAASYGFDEDLQGQQFPAGAGAAGAAIAGLRPVQRSGGEPDAVSHPALEEVRRELAVPVRWGRRGRAALVVAAFADGGAFGLAEIELASALARLASLALENADAFAERGRQGRLDRVASLVASELAPTHTVEDALEAIARTAAAAFEADRAQVRYGEDLPVVAGHGAGGRVTALERLATEERRVIAAGSASADARLDASEHTRLGSGAMLCVPLSGERPGEHPGVVTVSWNAPRTFGDADLALAERLQESAVAALERASLEEAEHRASTLARELQRVSALLAADLEPRTVLRQIVAQASDLLAADACTLRLLENGELVARAVLGEASELLSVRRPLGSDPIAAETLAGPAPVAIPDLSADPRVAEEPIVKDAGLAAYLGVPVQTADGEIQGVLAVYTRTPRRFRADEVDGLAALAGSAAVALRNALLYERLAQEKDAGEAILAQVADAIVASDADDRITRWNAAAERVTGLRARRVLGRELGELLRSELGDTDGMARAALEAASAGSSAPMEIRLERGGREIWLSITGASLRDPREERPGTVFAIRDVSDERRLDQVKSDFVATVSHELRTPLTSIYGFAETLLRADTTFGDDDRASFVRYIATEAERLTRLVDGLLSATRLEAGAVQLALGPVDVPALAREVATAARGRSDRHRVKLVVPAHPVYALADQDRVRQVLINLVDNAIKYSPDGGEVKVQARGRGNLVEMRVSDQGIGISELDQRNLFRKFFRVDASQRGGIRGVGLGLFLVRGFVAAMGGRIWVESELGSGSTFVVELPATEQTPSSTAATERVA